MKDIYISIVLCCLSVCVFACCVVITQTYLYLFNYQKFVAVGFHYLVSKPCILFRISVKWKFIRKKVTECH